MDAYTKAVCRELEKRKGQFVADTLYFGGGTPSLLGPKRIYEIVSKARMWFDMPSDAECTLEANPAEDLEEVFSAFAQAGGNRLSMGLQVADDVLLKKLGRRHSVNQVCKAVEDAKKNHISRISLDLMLGIEGQTMEHVKRGIELCDALGTEHVSSYMLKIEPGTPFALHTPKLPTEEETVDLYLFTCDELSKHGYEQYEISNFAKNGAVSRHNMKYWNCDFVVGIGPAAHSFWNGNRTYYERDVKRFIEGTLEEKQDMSETKVKDGSMEEYAMLRLRLVDGLREDLFYDRFGEHLPQSWRDRAKTIPSSLLKMDEEGICLTRDGFLVSNAILSRIL